MKIGHPEQTGVVVVRRKSTPSALDSNKKWDGDYLIMSEAEARKRNIEYYHYNFGISRNKFKDGLKGPHCLVDETWRTDDRGERYLFLPKMVVPVLYIDYFWGNRGGYLKGKGKKVIRLALATKTFDLYYYKNFHAYKQVRDNTLPINAEFTTKRNANVRFEFEPGHPVQFTMRDFEFVLEFRRLLAGSNLRPGKAALIAFKAIYGDSKAGSPLKGRQHQGREELPLRWLYLCVNYMEETKMNSNREVNDALSALKITPKWLLEKLKEVVEKNENINKDWQTAWDRLAFLTGLEEKSNVTGRIPESKTDIPRQLGTGATPESADLLPPGREEATTEVGSTGEQESPELADHEVISTTPGSEEAAGSSETPGEDVGGGTPETVGVSEAK